MKFSQKSQSIIEFSSLIILVIIGIIVMRPYVIRAINAHFKSLEESIEESQKEEFQETPLQELPSPPVCGDGTCTAPFEDPNRCCEDCGACGDGVCCSAKGETEITCNNDCGRCGDGQCNPNPPQNENASTCCLDCQNVCGDGACCTDEGLDNPGGTPVGADASCSDDCPQSQFCGDGRCDPPGEDLTNCCVDCYKKDTMCPDGTCDTPCENISNCPQEVACETISCSCFTNQSDCEIDLTRCCWGPPVVQSCVNPAEWYPIGCHSAGSCNRCAEANCGDRSNQSACCGDNCCSWYFNSAGQTCNKCGPSCDNSCRAVATRCGYTSCDDIP